MAVPPRTSHSTAPATAGVAVLPDAPSVAPHRDPRRRHVSRRVGFWTVGVTSAAMLAASSAPSPLYSVYQQRWGFSAVTLTAVFAVYVIALLATLLVAGRLSDHLGRRPVLAVGLLLDAGAMALFLSASGVGWLVAARILQGIATGAAIGVLGAYLLDLQPADGSRLGSLVNSIAPSAGLAVGAVLAGVLVQYAPDPSQLVFWLLGASFVVLAGITAVLPESVRPQPGALASLRPKVAVPPAARAAFLRSAPVMIATWALGGLVLSIGGSLLAALFGVTNHAWVGVVLAVLPAVGALGALVLRDVAPAPMVRIGSAALVLGAVGVLVALLTSTLAVFVVAVAVAGFGFGTGFLGALRTVTQLAEPHERAALLSAVFVLSYLGFSLPAVVAGYLVTEVGLRPTAIGYTVFVGVVATVTLLTELAGRRSTRR